MFRSRFSFWGLTQVLGRAQGDGLFEISCSAEGSSGAVLQFRFLCAYFLCLGHPFFPGNWQVFCCLYIFAGRIICKLLKPHRCLAFYVVLGSKFSTLLFSGDFVGFWILGQFWEQQHTPEINALTKRHHIFSVK